MALPAGRVGVKRNSVDWQGNVKGNGGSSDTYTKQQIDSKFGGLTFRDNEGTPQVKTADGDWVNFNGGVADISTTPNKALISIAKVSGVSLDGGKLELFSDSSKSNKLIELDLATAPLALYIDLGVDYYYTLTGSGMSLVSYTPLTSNSSKFSTSSYNVLGGTILISKA